MTRETVLNKVIQLFAMLTEAEEITAESNLIEDLGIGSMDILFVISSIEDEFKIHIPERALYTVVTVDDVVDMIYELVSK